MEPFGIDSDALRPSYEHLLQDLQSLRISSPRIVAPSFSTGRHDRWSLGEEPRLVPLASDLWAWTDGVDGISGYSSDYSRFHEYYTSYPRLSGYGIPAEEISEFNIYPQPVCPGGCWPDRPSGQLAHEDQYSYGYLVGSPREVVPGNLNARRLAGINLSLSSSSVMMRHARIHDLQGKMRNLAKSHTGHRILLEKMVALSTEEVDIVLRDLVHHLGELMVDPFASTVIQKLVDVCDNVKRDIVQLSKNGNGHQVVEQLLKVFPAEYNEHLSEPENFFELATNQHGCRVLSEHIKTVKGEMNDGVVVATVAYASTLAQHHYGNYVVQDLLTQQLPWRVLSNIHRQFQGIYSALSRNKFASHVVEKCLLSFPDVEFTQIVVELMDDGFLLLWSDEYANYVVQTMTVRSKALGLRIHNILVDRIRESRPLIESSIYGRKALDNLSNKHRINV